MEVRYRNHKKMIRKRNQVETPQMKKLTAFLWANHKLRPTMPYYKTRSITTYNKDVLNYLHRHASSEIATEIVGNHKKQLRQSDTVDLNTGLKVFFQNSINVSSVFVIKVQPYLVGLACLLARGPYEQSAVFTAQ